MKDGGAAGEGLSPRQIMSREIVRAHELVLRGEIDEAIRVALQLDRSADQVERDAAVYLRALANDPEAACFLRERLRQVRTNAFWHVGFGALAYSELGKFDPVPEELVDVSHVEGGGWFSDGAAGDLLTSQVARVSSLKEFRGHHARIGVPALIPGLMDGSPTRSVWERERFAEKYGAQLVTWYQSGNQASLRDYIESFEHNKGEESRDYLFDLKFLIDTQLDVTGDYCVPDEFSSVDWLPSPYVRHFYLGPKGSGIDFHSHPSALNVLVYGVKKWFLLPPAYNWVRSYPRLREINRVTKEVVPALPVQPIVAIQRSGESMFVPAGWVHAVINLTPTIGVAFEMFRNSYCEAALNLDFTCPEYDDLAPLYQP